jgi:putative FmdB family regulatory protein
MPIYEYECQQCGHQKEAIQKISDPPLKLCPACNQETLRKLISAAAFRLSGTGWYETDFKDKKDQKKLHTSDSKPPASETTSSDSKATETKSSDSKATGTKDSSSGDSKSTKKQDSSSATKSSKPAASSD